MATGPSHEYIPLVPIGVRASTPQAPLYLRNGAILRHRPMSRIERIVRVVWYPLLLITLYFLFTLWPKQPPILVDPTAYLSYAGKSALSTTIVLPKLQYKFQNNEGGHDERRQKVKELIKQTWDLYVQQAWGWDVVKPVRGGGRDTRYLLFRV
jgi:hypothetical protein